MNENEVKRNLRNQAKYHTLKKIKFLYNKWNFHKCNVSVELILGANKLTNFFKKIQISLIWKWNGMNNYVLSEKEY